MTKNDQKRTDIRENEVDLSFRAIDPAPHNFFPGITRDASTDGFFVAIDRPLPAGTKLHLSFITETKKVEGHAEVCWQHRSNNATPEAKVKLLDIAPDDRDLIEFYIRQKK